MCQLNCNIRTAEISHFNEIRFSTLDNPHKEISLAALSGGAQQLLMLFSAIYLGDYGTLLIDEPEISLHTFSKEQICRFLFEQQQVTILIVTHSEDFISVPNLAATAHCIRKNSETVVHSIPKVLSEIQVNRTPTLAVSREVAHMYFAERALFLEGSSDFLVFSALFWLVKHDPTVAQFISMQTKFSAVFC